MRLLYFITSTENTLSISPFSSSHCSGVHINIHRFALLTDLPLWTFTVHRLSIEYSLKAFVLKKKWKAKRNTCKTPTRKYMDIFGCLFWSILSYWHTSTFWRNHIVSWRENSHFPSIFFRSSKIIIWLTKQNSLCWRAWKKNNKNNTRSRIDSFQIKLIMFCVGSAG